MLIVWKVAAHSDVLDATIASLLRSDGNRVVRSRHPACIYSFYGKNRRRGRGHGLWKDGVPGPRITSWEKNHSINCVYLVLFVHFSFFLPSGHFLSFLSFALVLIFSFSPPMIKLPLLFCFCISPFLHCPCLQYVLRLQELRLERSMETLFMVMSCLPPSGGFCCCCRLSVCLFIWMGCVGTSGIKGRKMLKMTAFTGYLCTVGRRVEYHKGNFTRTWLAGGLVMSGGVLVDLCVCGFPLKCEKQLPVLPTSHLWVGSWDGPQSRQHFAGPMRVCGSAGCRSSQSLPRVSWHPGPCWGQGTARQGEELMSHGPCGSLRTERCLCLKTFCPCPLQREI